MKKQKECVGCQDGSGEGRKGREKVEERGDRLGDWGGRSFCQGEKVGKDSTARHFWDQVGWKRNKMNQSGRMINNLRRKKELLFEVGKEGQQESRNWLASFTKSGCSICRGEEER